MARHTWRDAAARWIRDTDYKADHQKDVGKLRWLDQYLGALYLDEISRDVVDSVVDVKRQQVKLSTVNRYLSLIRAILRMARDEWEWLHRVPRIRLCVEPKGRVRWLTPEQAAKLLRELPDHLRAMAAFTLATGLRQRNVSYLRWDQVDLGRGMAWIYADQSKSRKAIAVPLNRDALLILRTQQGLNSEWVFVYQGRPVDRASTKAWAAAKRRAGIADFRWHDLRHTWASWHAQKGTTLHQLMELGGWSSMDMVLRYAHFTGEHLRVASQNIDRIIA